MAGGACERERQRRVPRASHGGKGPGGVLGRQEQAKVPPGHHPGRAAPGARCSLVDSVVAVSYHEVGVRREAKPALPAIRHACAAHASLVRYARGKK